MELAWTSGGPLLISMPSLDMWWTFSSLHKWWILLPSMASLDWRTFYSLYKWWILLSSMPSLDKWWTFAYLYA